MPRYLITLIESEDFYAEGQGAFAEIMQLHKNFSAAVSEAGATVLGGEALQPVATATFLRKTQTPDVVVVDNPAPDVKEVLGGYYLIEASDDEHALELAKLCPAVYGYVELRPVWEFDA